MIPDRLEDLTLVVADSEYCHEPGERLELVAWAWKIVGSVVTYTYTRDEILQWTTLPFPHDAHTLIICYNTAAEAAFLQVRGLEMPQLWWDCMAESRRSRNVCIPGEQLKKWQRKHPEVYKPNREIALPEAADLWGIDGGTQEEKEASRRLVTERKWATGDPEIWRQIRAYCAHDVEITERLFLKSSSGVDVAQAIVRGSYNAELGKASMRGIPADRGVYQRIQGGYPAVLRGMRQVIDPEQVRLTPKGVVRPAWVEARLAALGALRTHPRTAKGRVSTRASHLRATAEDFPDDELTRVVQWAEMRSLFRERKGGGLQLSPVGHDGRFRYSLFAYGSHTGRSLGRGDALMQQSAWLRGLIQPPAGETLLYCDYGGQEFLIAGALSGDQNMIDAYCGGDPYAWLAELCGALTPAMAESERMKVRAVFKTCVLGRLYGLGLLAFRRRTGLGYAAALKIWQFLDTYFAKFFDWQARVIRRARTEWQMSTAYGWTARVYPATGIGTLLNWLMQATAANVLQVAVLRLAAEGFAVLTVVYDAILLSVPTRQAEVCQVRIVELMDEAAQIVIGHGMRVKVDRVDPGGRLLSDKTQWQWDRVMESLAADHGG